MRARRSMGFAILVTSFLPALTLGATMRDPDNHFFQQSFGDVREELETARHEDKIGIFVAFDNDKCPCVAIRKRRYLIRREHRSITESIFASFGSTGQVAVISGGKSRVACVEWETRSFA